jgi:S-DNA-T family DNA segregation ATPase FtsK/SpoIIIE
MPLNVIIIDELAYLSAMVTDKKLRDRAQNAIGTILVLGRATGYSLVGCSQSVLKEVLSFRDYFPTRVALGMPAPMIDLCLGEGAREAGALADQIPLREAGAGYAYVLEETSNKSLLVRAAWCSDEAIRMMLADPQAFGVESDESLPQYEQGYTGADALVQLGFDGQPLDAGQSEPQPLRWEDLPPEVQRLALQSELQWRLGQE